MVRDTTILGHAFFLLIASFAFPQNGSSQACPEITPGTLGCELVAWSKLQTPVPLPEADANRVSPTDHANQLAAQSQNDQTRTTRQTITGIIVRGGEKCVLKAGDNSIYQLDDQDQARQFRDKKVRIVGTLNASTNIFHIEGIETVS